MTLTTSSVVALVFLIEGSTGVGVISGFGGTATLARRLIPCDQKTIRI